MDLSKDRQSAITGTLLVVVGAIGFSSKAIFIKLAYADASQVDAITLMALRMLMSLPFFLLVAVIHKDSGTKPLHGRDWASLVVLSFLGYYLASFLDFKGLEYLSAGLERLILFLYPTLVVLLSALLYRQPISLIQAAALALTYAGILLVYRQVSAVASGQVLPGSVLVFGSALVYAVYLTGSGRVIPRFGSKRFTAYSMSLAAILTLVHFFATRPLSQLMVPPRILGLSLVLAVVATVLPAFLINAGIRRIGASQAAITGAIGPVSTLVLAYVVLDERLGRIQVVGALMVMAGVVLVGRFQAKS